MCTADRRHIYWFISDQNISILRSGHWRKAGPRSEITFGSASIVCVCQKRGILLFWCDHSELLVCDLNRTPIVMAKHGGPCVHFSGISTCGRTSRETVSHPQHPPLPRLCKISLPVYVIVTNERLQPLTATWYNSLVLSFSLLKIWRRWIKHRTFLRGLRSWRTVVDRSALQLCRRAFRLFHVRTPATSGRCLALCNKRSH